MASPQLKEEFYTIDYIYALPEGERAELIDGQIYNLASPNRKHQSIIFQVARKIADHIDSQGGSCETYIAPFAVFLNEDIYTYVEPDISVICDPNKLTDKGCNGAPDWIVEVVSPSSKQMDYMIKLFKYQKAGVREYWIVDPDKGRVWVYHFELESIEEYTFQDSVPVGIFEGLSIDFSRG